jgi:predicted anti-sigma-YlaC factor YlaD
LKTDYPVMTTHGCEPVREALSARMDGEDPGLTDERIDGHLAGCAGCRSWSSSAEQVTRTVRVHSVVVPDLTAGILAAVAQREHAGRDLARVQAAGRRQVLRIALAVSAVVQLALALPALLAGLGVTVGLDTALVHTSREAASFDIALAVGFALAAWRPERARAFVPVAFVLAGCLTLTSAFDIAHGITALAHEATHVAALAQAGLLWALSRGTVGGAARESHRPATVGR